MDKPLVPESIHRVFGGRIFSIAVERVTLSNGHTLDVEVVRHPGSVVIVPLTAQRQVILVNQYRHAVGRSLWELPAGSLKLGEDPTEAAARECQEEIGLLPETLQPLGAFFSSPGYCDEAMTFFLATDLRQPRAGDRISTPDADEQIETRAFSLDDLLSRIAVGEIADMKTVAGVALLRDRP